MLGILACALAREIAPRLDLGLVAQFALIHDLVEAYAGDTNALRMMTEKDHDEKRAREHAALDRIREEMGESFPWVHETIEAYESLATPEARFVKTIDKCLPGITHALNRGATLKRERMSRDNHKELCEEHRRRFPATFAHDQSEAMDFWEAVVATGDGYIEYSEEA